VIDHDYACLRAKIGSIFVDRRAGIQQSSNTTTVTGFFISIRAP
jgi:hypothetical protein